jgi:hypothetical protein
MKTNSRLFAGVLTLAAMTQLAAAATVAQPTCITPAEVRAGMAFLAPTMIRGVRAKCATVLSRTRTSIVRAIGL